MIAETEPPTLLKSKKKTQGLLLQTTNEQKAVIRKLLTNANSENQKYRSAFPRVNCVEEILKDATSCYTKILKKNSWQLGK